jgi:hypothetical protein
VPFDIDKKIAVGFRNYAEANYKITVNQMLNIPKVTNVYLHDKIANVYYDIKNSLFDVTLVGTNNTQYEITFKNSTLAVKDLKQQSFTVISKQQNAKFNNKKPLFKDLTSCDLYDISGKLIFKKINWVTILIHFQHQI